MHFKPLSIRTFIGAKNHTLSRSFYLDLGFQENIIDSKLSYFHCEQLGFYLQDAYVKDWVNNSMIFMEVEDLDHFWQELQAANLPEKYENVRIEPIRNMVWGRECFIHDPSGILWHIGSFYN